MVELNLLKRGGNDMEKKLILKKDADNYRLEFDSDFIDITDKKINSQIVYDKIYSKITNEDESVSIKVSTDLVDKTDLIIFGQIKAYFKAIDESINKQLKNK